MESRLKELIRKDYPEIDADESLSQVLALFRKNVHEIIVTENKEVVGVIRPTDALKKITEPSAKARNICVKLPTIKLNDNVDEGGILKLIVQADVRHIPVLNKYEKIVGVIYDLDLLNSIIDETYSDIEIKEIVSRPLETLKETDKLSMALSMIKSRNFTRIPVENENGELIGLITAHQLAILPELQRAQFGEVSGEKIRQLDTIEIKNLVIPMKTISENASLYEVVQKMVQEDIHGLVVTPANQTGPLKAEEAGIITTRDVIFYMFEGEREVDYQVWVMHAPDEDVQHFAQRKGLSIMENFSRWLGKEARLYVRFKKNAYQQQRAMYSWTCTVRLTSSNGIILNTTSTEFGAEKAMNDALEKLERLLLEFKEKSIDRLYKVPSLRVPE